MTLLERAKPWIVVAVVAFTTAGLGACGVRGSLDPPTEAKADGQAKSSEAAAAGETSAAKPKPHEPFVLDGLLR
jgi:predicted small lipoprotein YifL